MLRLIFLWSKLGSLACVISVLTKALIHLLHDAFNAAQHRLFLSFSHPRIQR